MPAPVDPVIRVPRFPTTVLTTIQTGACAQRKHDVNPTICESSDKVVTVGRDSMAPRCNEDFLPVERVWRPEVRSHPLESEIVNMVKEVAVHFGASFPVSDIASDAVVLQLA